MNTIDDGTRWPKALQPYKKLVASVVTAALAWGNIVVNSAPTAITAPEWISGGVLLAGAFGVYKATNAPAN